VTALEQAAQRLGKSLSKDAGQAVERMYRDAGSRLEKIVLNVQNADHAQAEKFLALVENVGKSKGRTLKPKAAARQAAKENQVNRMIDPENAAAHDFEVTIDSKKYPESAQHIQEAQSGTIWRGDTSTQGTPAPSNLTVNRAGADANRDASLSGITTRPNLDRDEYPPAMFSQGGAGASVKYIGSGDNQGAGASIGNQLRGLPDGTIVKVTVK
jgi:hypothetical protein